MFVTGKAANGLSYGATIEFEMDAVGAAGVAAGAGTTFSTDEMWGFVSSPTLGTLRFGDEDSAANLMQVRPPQATGFLRSRVDLVRQGGTRYMFASLNDGNDATKIIYLSPQWAGFDFGLSFALNGGEGEREVLGNTTPPGNLQRARTTRENEFTGALRYRGTFGAVGVAAGFAFTTATAARNSANDTLLPALRGQNPNAYSVGATVTFAGFTFGGEWHLGPLVRHVAGIGSTPPNPRGFSPLPAWCLVHHSGCRHHAGGQLRPRQPAARHDRGGGGAVGAAQHLAHGAGVHRGRHLHHRPGLVGLPHLRELPRHQLLAGSAANNFGGGLLGSVGGVPSGGRRTTDAITDRHHASRSDPAHTRVCLGRPGHPAAPSLFVGPKRG